MAMPKLLRRIVVAGGLVAVALLVYFNYFRNTRPARNTGGGMPFTVLVAKVPIHKGTPASVIATPGDVHGRVDSAEPDAPGRDH
jgi:hypothetical protein